jgi:C4-dicarboxylate transporter, DctM subunit
MEYLVVTAVLLLMLAVGVPIYIVLGAISGVLLLLEGMPLLSIGQIYVDHLNSLTLLAIPFFVMSATFMERGGIAAALIDFANVLVGRMTGGLAVAGVLATTVFAAICGSSVATAVALGVILVPAMIEQKYERPFAVGLVGASGTMGILIPPQSGFHCLCHDRRRVGPASVSRWSRSWDNASWLVYCLRGLVCKSSGLSQGASDIV